MKVHNALTDDDGVRWEFFYTEEWYTADDGEQRTRVVDFTYRRADQGEPRYRLPPWADVAEEWKINLCFFDEDEDGEICRFWTVSSAPMAVVS